MSRKPLIKWDEAVSKIDTSPKKSENGSSQAKFQPVDQHYTGGYGGPVALCFKLAYNATNSTRSFIDAAPPVSIENAIIK